MNNWPAWYFGPNDASAIFERAEDVPEGWQDHPAKAEKPRDPFDHGGDGKPGGSAPGRKVTRRGNRR